jgi:hypothetical protein
MRIGGAMVMIMMARDNADSPNRALCQSYQQRHLGQVGGMNEGVRILPISI